MAWVNAQERLPAKGRAVQCRLQHAGSKKILEHRLIHVDEADCNWRTAGDRCELNYDWNVVAWEEDRELS